MSLTKVPDDLQLTAYFIWDFVRVCDVKCAALTATRGCHLRANSKNRRFARNPALEP